MEARGDENQIFRATGNKKTRSSLLFFIIYILQS